MIDKIKQYTEYLTNIDNDSDLVSETELKNSLSSIYSKINERSYNETAVKTSKVISEFYLQHHEFSATLKSLYDFVQPDADSEKLDSSVKRDLGMPSGYVRSPLNKDSALN
ncbi:hypothetical protein [Pediococcus argentinicus]|uniref:Bacteriocin immunity protein n=1 Tax=Pediococcus argentinicus TaxID=480391 RepID=A0A0R2NGC6_9LACO|nr:hypothetical protein [Pediococcus argentinicus]KRO24852.1 hypothetical protein IV88_GL000681 [Pediococcus argentinicus]NKZ22681.1 hypothetical protein [Pediococcus argentinicus]GEP19678.1 hypothetical protein LSA03_10620 [Pediococcus argentinicus]